METKKRNRGKIEGKERRGGIEYKKGEKKEKKKKRKRKGEKEKEKKKRRKEKEKRRNGKLQVGLPERQIREFHA
jgi:hypothetical protein